MTAVTITLNPTIDRSATVDRVLSEEKLSCRDVRDEAGGGGINVARVMGRLRQSSHALWSQGGHSGRQLACLLDAECVSHRGVSVQGDVRQNMVIYEESTKLQFRFGLPGSSLGRADRQAWLHALAEVLPTAELVVLSGSLPPDTPAEFYADILELIPQGVRVIVDTKGAALRQALRRGVYLVKPNSGELAAHVGRELEGEKAICAAAVQLVHEGGAEHVVVSLGGDGAVLASEGRCVKYSAPEVPILSKVGAGDSMVGAIVASLKRGLSIEESVRFGVAAGTAAVMTPGTDLCHREQVEQLVRQVTSEPLSSAGD